MIRGPSARSLRIRSLPGPRLLIAHLRLICLVHGAPLALGATLGGERTSSPVCAPSDSQRPQIKSRRARGRSNLAGGIISLGRPSATGGRRQRRTRRPDLACQRACGRHWLETREWRRPAAAVATLGRARRYVITNLISFASVPAQARASGLAAGRRARLVFCPHPHPRHLISP